jgi:hypothetical protein
MTRKHLLIFAAVVTAALLIGYIPQFLKARALNQQVEMVRQQLAGCQSRARVAGLRDLMGLAYVEVNQKNFGLAAQHVSRFYERASLVRAEVADPGLERVLDEAMTRRDEITAGLARGDAAVAAPIERTYRELLQAAPQPDGPQV